jgi:hypothetical protein
MLPIVVGHVPVAGIFPATHLQHGNKSQNEALSLISSPCACSKAYLVGCKSWMEIFLKCCEILRAADTCFRGLHDLDEADSAGFLSGPGGFASRSKPSPYALGKHAVLRGSEPFSAITRKYVSWSCGCGAYLSPGFVLPICCLSSAVER